MTVAQDKRWQAELEIIEKLHRIPSCREMQALLLKEYGIKANHGTVNTDLKQDLESLTETEYENQKTGILGMLNDEINIAHTLAKNGEDPEIQLKAMNTVSKLSKTKSEILIKFRKAQSQISKEEKPEINLYIGQFKEIDMKKFNKLDGATEDDKDT